jgi:hypothetical protein
MHIGKKSEKTFIKILSLFFWFAKLEDEETMKD